MSAVNDLVGLEAAIVEAVSAHKETLGIKTVCGGVSIDTDGKEIQQIIANFPAVLVAFAHESPVIDGSNLQLPQTWALLIADRNLSLAFSARMGVYELLVPLRQVLHKKTLLPNVQRSAFYYQGCALGYKDASIVTYVMTFQTMVLLDGRTY